VRFAAPKSGPVFAENYDMIIDVKSDSGLRLAVERMQQMDEPQTSSAASLGVDIAPDNAFTRILSLAAQLLDAPSAAFAIINLERHYFRARLNLPGRESKRLVAFCASGMLNDEPLVVEDTLEDKRYRGDPLVASEPGVRFLISAPVRGPEMLSLGALAVLDYRPRRPTLAQIEGIRNLAALLEREILLRSLMRIDPLTGLQTRFYYEFEMDREWRRARRTRSPVTALLIDVDKMADYNEVFGNLSGDRALTDIGRLLTARFRRASDVLVRVGGDRMLVLLPETESDDGLRLATTICRDIEALGMGNSATHATLTVSIGCATANNERDFARGYESLIESAENALSAAKLAGGNRVTRFVNDRPSPPEPEARLAF